MLARDPGWCWEGSEPNPSVGSLGARRALFRDAEGKAIAGVYRERSKTPSGRSIRERIWWWAKPSFAENRVSTVEDAVANVATYRPEPIPQDFIDRLCAPWEDPPKRTGGQ